VSRRGQAQAARKRRYLSSADRRDDLLGVAAGLVERGGWSALTMQGLAAAAGVSRQLVYQHFADLPDLVVSVVRRLFERTRADTERLVRRAAATDAARDRATIAAAYQLFLDMPRAQRRALRALSGDAGPELPELGRTRRRVRAEIMALWVPWLRLRSGVDRETAGALAWMTIASAWALTDLVDDGAIGARVAQELLAGVVERLTARPRARAGSRAREPRRRGARLAGKENSR